MKAIRIHEFGGAAELRHEDTDPPAALGENEALVQLRAASVNRVDLELRAGTRLRPPLPRIPGADGAGIVRAVGSRVQSVRPGDAVCLFPFQECGECSSCLRSDGVACAHRVPLGVRAAGTYAEYVRVPARCCLPIPPGLSFEEAAAFPLVYLMAWRMLMSDAKLQPGEWVMILGAGGGIATAALQLAAAFGARVIVLSRQEKKLAPAQELGAMHAVRLDGIDPFRAVRSLTGKRGVDIAVNCVGGASWTGTLSALARGGRLVTCGALCGQTPQTDLRRVFWNHLRIMAARSAGRQELEKVLGFFADGRHKPVIDSVFSLREAARAHERLEGGGQFGKVVLRIDD